MFRLILICSLFVFISCQSKKNTKAKGEQNSVPAQTAATDNYAPLPPQDHLWIGQNCDYIDYLYYQLPMSMSFHDKASIVTAVRHISEEPAPKSIPCKSIGRISYQQEGEIKLEAEMHFADGCGYFVFLKNNKPAYGNKMTPQAVKFYNGVFERAKIVPK